jgi:protein involved in polysaccharide export with SLBB domain
MDRTRHSWWAKRVTGFLLGLCGAVGCASFSNPTMHSSIPVHRLPPEVFGRPREAEKPIPLTLLRQEQPKEYKLGPGDLLAIYAEGLIGDRTIVPPIIQVPPAPGARVIPPTIGYPIPIQENGLLFVPLIDPIDVREELGRTLGDIQEEISKKYIERRLVPEGQRPRVFVGLVKPRTYHVNVIREDGGGVLVSGGGQLTNSRRGTGIALDLEAYDNDVLSALTRSGGLPGLDAANAVIIQRGAPPNVKPGETVAAIAGTQQQIRIPLRMRPDDQLPFDPKDVVLKTGDIIFIESRESQVYYTGGLMPVAEIALPRDYDLDVLEAVTQTHGPLFNGAFNFNNLGGQILPSGLGTPSPSLLTVIRKTPNCGQITIRVDLNRAAVDPRERILVQPGDFLILQETMGESFTRYVTQSLRFNLASVLLRQRDAIITSSYNFP